MAQRNARCTVCNAEIVIEENKDANICPCCNEAIVTEKAIRLYNGSVKRKRNVWKSLGKGLLMVVECVGYLFYCLFFIWLFFDITDNLKKK